MFTRKFRFSRFLLLQLTSLLLFLLFIQTTFAFQDNVLSKPIGLGDSGDDVKILQNYLTTTGDYTYPEVTGYFGPATEKAVQTFQSNNNIVNSGDSETTGYGLVGPKTLAALHFLIGENNDISLKTNHETNELTTSVLGSQVGYKNQVTLYTDSQAETMSTNLSKVLFDDYFNLTDPKKNINITITGDMTQLLDPKNTYIQKNNNPTPAPLVVESSSGFIKVADATSYTDTSDIWSARKNETLSFILTEIGTVNSQKIASTNKISFKLAGVDKNNVSLRVYDSSGELTYFGIIPEGQSLTKKQTIYLEGNDIHRVSFINETGDWFLVGSYADSVDKSDIKLGTITNKNTNVDSAFSIQVNKSCSVGSTTIKSTQTLNLYSQTIAPYGSSCALLSQAVTCVDGVVYGDSQYKNSSCSVPVPPKITYPKAPSVFTDSLAETKLTSLQPIRFDDYFNLINTKSNINLTITGLVDQLLNPQSKYTERNNKPSSAPMIIESSRGFIKVADATSLTDTSDIWNSKKGESTIFTLVDTGSVYSHKIASTNKISFKLAGVDKNEVSMRVYDSAGVLVYSGIIPDGQTFTKKQTVYIEGSDIHRVVFINEMDSWFVVGSYADNANKNDIGLGNITNKNLPVQAPREIPDIGTSGLGNGIPSLSVRSDLVQDPTIKRGPYLRLDNGDVVRYEQTGNQSGGNAVSVSKDNGRTWGNPITINSNSQLAPYLNVSMTKASDGSIIIAYTPLQGRVLMVWDYTKNQVKNVPRWDQWTVRSTDNGLTWSQPQLQHIGYNGGHNHVYASTRGPVVSLLQDIKQGENHWQIVAYYSKDFGSTWSKSTSVIDIPGNGNHAGAMEPIVYEKSNGDLLMLIRSNFDYMYESVSKDGGVTWSKPIKSNIESSSTKVEVLRMKDGTLAMVYNQVRPEGVSENEWIATRSHFTTRRSALGEPNFDTDGASWHREELSMAFSFDDGLTWSVPKVLARQYGQWRSIASLFEINPGELQMSTWQDFYLINNKWTMLTSEKDQLRYRFTVKDIYDNN